MKPLIPILIVLLLCITTPITAEKSKGLFSGDIFQADLDLFTADVPEIPSFTTEDGAVQAGTQSIGEWIEIGKTQLQNGNWAAAAEAFSQVTEQDPTNDIGWEGYLLSIRGSGDFYKLLTVSEEAAEKNPGYGSIWKYKGIAYNGIDQPDEALSAFDKALEVDPSYYMAQYYKGLALVSLKRYTEAVSSFEQVVQADSGYAKAWNNMGVALNFLGKYDEAIKAFDMAYELDPSFNQALVNKEIAVEEQKRGNLGLGDIFDDALSLNPSRPAVTVVPTEVPTPVVTAQPIYSPVPTPEVTPMPTDSPVPVLTAQAYDQVINEDLDDATIWYNKGNDFKELGRYEEAIKAYNQALIINPDDAIAWNSKGYSLNELGRYEEAIQALEKALEIDPEFASPWNNMGYALNELGKYEEAIKAYEKALNINPAFETAQNNRDIAMQNLQKSSRSGLQPGSQPQIPCYGNSKCGDDCCGSSDGCCQTKYGQICYNPQNHICRNGDLQTVWGESVIPVQYGRGVPGSSDKPIINEGTGSL